MPLHKKPFNLLFSDNVAPYAYEYDEHSHDSNSTTADVEANDTVTDQIEIKNEESKSDLPKRSRRQAPLATADATADYAYDEAQQVDPEENVRLLCCSFQRYLVKDLS